jgi:hypothetical protein
MIDFYLAEEPAGEVELEILDAQGNVIRGYSSTSEGYRYEEQQGMRAPQMVRVGGEQEVPKGAGMHRFIWDMEYPGPVVPDIIQRGDDGASYGGPEDDGPLAAPGTYQVRLIVEGEPVGTRSFELLIDPRVQEDGTTVTDLREQHELNIDIRDALSRAHRLAAEVLRAKARAEEADGDHAALLDELSALENALFSEREPVSYPEPMLLDQLSYLYGMTTGAGQMPGRDAFVRLDQLREKISAYEGRLAGLKSQAGGVLGDETR